MRSKGLQDSKRHFQREEHLRADQRIRVRYHPSEVLGSDGPNLYGTKLEAEKELFMQLNIPDLDQQRPFNYDVIKRKLNTFKFENLRMLRHVELLLIFLEKGGQLWTQEEHWTQARMLTGHSGSTADFKWTASLVSVGCLLNVCKVKTG